MAPHIHLEGSRKGCTCNFSIYPNLARPKSGTEKV